MKFTKFAMLAFAGSLVTADPGSIRSASAVDDGAGVATAAGSDGPAMEFGASVSNTTHFHRCFCQSALSWTRAVSSLTSSASPSRCQGARPTFLRDGDGEDWGIPKICSRHNGCACVTDDNCNSGRCSKYLKCENKLSTGGWCGENNDCKSGSCRMFRCRA